MLFGKMRVGTWNIQAISGVRPTFAERQQQVLQNVSFPSFLSGSDFFAYQEVDLNVVNSEVLPRLSNVTGHSSSWNCGVHSLSLIERESVCLVYENQHYREVEHLNFALSETPKVKGTGWGRPRVVTGGRFSSSMGVSESFWVFSVHIDGWEAERGIRTLREVLEKQAANFDTPVIVLGDLNALTGPNPWGEPLVQILTGDGFLRDAWAEMHPGEIGVTSCSVGVDCVPQGYDARLDYVLVSKHFKINSAEILPIIGASDHYPVYADLELP